MNRHPMTCLAAVLFALPLAAVAQHTHSPAHAEPARVQDSRTTGRSPDYSDGVRRGHMPGGHMRDDAMLGKLMVDRLEAFAGRDVQGQRWEIEAWYGNDIDKQWLRTEGQRNAGTLHDADVELLWNHAVAAFWSTQLGVRHDFGEGPSRNWVAFGVQGLAPYGFDVEATAYAGPSGRTAARLRVGYELLFTQRLVLQPELEANAYGQDDAARGVGSGMSDMRLGLRLRYEVRRRVAPYVGVVWTHRFGTSADFARANQRPVTERQWVAGVRMWF